MTISKRACLEFEVKPTVIKKKYLLNIGGAPIHKGDLSVCLLLIRAQTVKPTSSDPRIF